MEGVDSIYTLLDITSSPQSDLSDKNIHFILLVSQKCARVNCPSD